MCIACMCVCVLCMFLVPMEVSSGGVWSLGTGVQAVVSHVGAVNQNQVLCKLESAL